MASTCVLPRHSSVNDKISLPSPPNSSCGDERESELSPPLHYPKQTDLPENYTIDHSKPYTPSLPQEECRATKRTIKDVNDLEEIYKCHHCGKQYKHRKSLFKHQWEHSEYWEVTSKFLMTKHQQVQLLEAASILINMKNCSSSSSNSSSSSSSNSSDEEDDEIDVILPSF